MMASNRMGFSQMESKSIFNKSRRLDDVYKGPRPLPSPEEARGIFDELDADNSGFVSRDELIAWIAKSGMLHGLDKEDSVTQANHVFDEMDKDGNGTLDFQEFFEYLKLIEAEQDNIRWASRHYITTLPPALPSSIQSEFSFEALKKKLHRKIEQFTSQDTDRLRQTIRLFRNQTIRSRRADNEASEMKINKREFSQVLAWLGLFSSKEQSDRLFEQFDVNGDGDLTVHEFLTRARPDDYPHHGRSQRDPVRKQYHTMKRSFHQPRANVSLAQKFHGTNALTQSLKTKMADYAREGTYSETQAKEDLLKAFETVDEWQNGYVSEKEMKDVLDMLEVHLDVIQQERLMNQFGQRQGKLRMFHYPQFVEHLYQRPVNATDPRTYRLSARTMDYSKSRGSEPAISTYQATMRPFAHKNLNLELTAQGPFRGTSSRFPAALDDHLYESIRLDGSATFSRPGSSLSNTRESGLGSFRMSSRGSSRGQSRGMRRSSSQPTFYGQRLRTPRLEDVDPRSAAEISRPVTKPYY